MKLNINVNDLKVKVEKIGGILLKGAAAIGMIALLSKVNDELDKYGVHVGYTTDGGLDIKAGGKKKTEQPEARQKPPKKDSSSFTFNNESVQERSIVDLMYAAERTYNDPSKRQNAESIFNIAMAGDDHAKIVAIQALSRIARGTYSDGVRNYISSAIAEIGSTKPEEKPKEETEEAPNEE